MTLKNSLCTSLKISTTQKQICCWFRGFSEKYFDLYSQKLKRRKAS